MSKLIIKTYAVTNVRPHPNADKLEIANVGGWQVIVSKGKYNDGDEVVFIPPDSIVPKDLHESLGVTNYLSELPVDYDAPVGARRVKAARLRGQPSYGLVMDIPTGMNDFDELATRLGITKWEPPVKESQGDIESDHYLFHKYTDIERYQNFPDTIPDGEIVVITEKVHGTNCRVGMVPVAQVDGSTKCTMMAGSHSCRRKEGDGIYWLPLKSPQYINLQIMIEALYKNGPVVVFGEIYGPGVQDMNYGQNSKQFLVFDISVNGQYLSYTEKRKLCEKYGVGMVPILYRGPMSVDIVNKYTDGPAKTGESTGKFKGREGIVITPEVERHDPIIGRVILKSISVDYLDRKGGTDSH